MIRSRPPGEERETQARKGVIVDKHRIAGKAKKAEGKITGDKGRVQEGKEQEAWGKTKDKAGDAWDSVKDKAKAAKD